jgi:L-ribulose-5-phosphate 4-epimerase
MANDVRKEVCEANRALAGSGLVELTWGNVSGWDEERSLFYIKPSGVAYEDLTPEHMVAVDLEGRVVEGNLVPSSDTKTHLVLYRSFPGVGGICHTHSPAATALAQAGRELPCYGTTHADHFYGTVPLVRILTPHEVAEDYETHTGHAIVEHFRHHGIDPRAVPAALQHHHAPFTWGTNPRKALENSIALEMCARMALDMWKLDPSAPPLPDHLLQKHYLRKHGANAYYGQK